MEVEKCPGTGRALPANRSSGHRRRGDHRIAMLLRRVEAQICQDILRLRRAVRDDRVPHRLQERFRKLIAKREEMLKSVRTHLCTGF